MGIEEYLAAAKKGMDFIIISQGPSEQAAWSQQLDMNMKPAHGRTFEPAAYRTRIAVNNIKELQKYYTITGDRRYLAPIPDTIKWLENSSIEILDDGKHRYAKFYEVDTNLPIYERRTEEINDEGFFVTYFDYKPTGTYRNDYREYNIQAIKVEFDRICNLSPEQAVAQYRAGKTVKQSFKQVDPVTVTELISSMNDYGLWIGDISVHFREKKARSESKRIIIPGISTKTYINNMHIFIQYLKTLKSK